MTFKIMSPEDESSMKDKKSRYLSYFCISLYIMWYFAKGSATVRRDIHIIKVGKQDTFKKYYQLNI